MARYHFQACDAEVAHEHQTHDFDDLATMRHAAIAFAAQKMPAIGSRLFDSDLRLDVTNDDGLVLLSIMVVGVDNTTQYPLVRTSPALVPPRNKS